MGRSNPLFTTLSENFFVVPLGDTQFPGIVKFQITFRQATCKTAPEPKREGNRLEIGVGNSIFKQLDFWLSMN